MRKQTLMLQGTTSDAGKSTLVAGLCRVWKRRGRHVAPFKPQNMALNSAVTEDGGEIGRAQALQAQACGLQPHSDMNPVLIKPSSDTEAQVIIQGKVREDMDAVGFHRYKPEAMRAVLDSYHRMISRYDAIVVEGAGSPAEINLREGDIANMGFAEEVDCPVIIVADIDKGGVFAHIVGTLALLSKSEQARVIGFVINKFRGELALLQPGIDWLETYTGKSVLGVIPYLQNLALDSEDSIETTQTLNENASFKIVVPALPRISNHTDFDALRHHSEVELIFIPASVTPPPADLVILPGSKNVIEDLDWLRSNDWEKYLKHHLRYGGKLIGICGGLQMLGTEINDPLAVESNRKTSRGLGFLPLVTCLEKEKVLSRGEGVITFGKLTAPVSGYEIHHGVTHEIEELNKIIRFNGQPTDGYLSDDEQIFASYLHGIFDNPAATQMILKWAGLDSPKSVDIASEREKSLDILADNLEQHLDLEQLETQLRQFSKQRECSA